MYATSPVLEFVCPSRLKSGVLVIAVSPDQKLTAFVEDLDRQQSGLISKALAKFENQECIPEYIILEGLEADGPDLIVCSVLNAARKERSYQRIVSVGIAKAVERGVQLVSFACQCFEESEASEYNVASEFAYSAYLAGSVNSNWHGTKVAPQTLQVWMMVSDIATARRLCRYHHEMAKGVQVARDLVNAPPSSLTPYQLAEEAKRLAILGIEVEIIPDEFLQDRGFVGTDAVGKGSCQPSCVVLLHWRNTDSPEILGFAGKGVTFDAGGLTMKGPAEQAVMKMDMGGAAAVIGAMRTIAVLGLEVNVTAAIGAVENLPGPNAFKPGDVLRMANGTTVEVNFPDAEGRLVLADLIVHLRENYRPVAIIDVATLTLSVLIALGPRRTGLFTSDEMLAERCLAASAGTNENVWQLPLDQEFLDQLHSDIADMKNMPSPGMFGALAGSASVAAAFLREFAEDTPFAHLDIGGSAWSSVADEQHPVGATGAGTELLVWLADRFAETRHLNSSGSAAAYAAND